MDYTELDDYKVWVSKMDVIDRNFADTHTSSKARMFAHEVFDIQASEIRRLESQLQKQQQMFNALLLDISGSIKATVGNFGLSGTSIYLGDLIVLGHKDNLWKTSDILHVTNVRTDEGFTGRLDEGVSVPLVIGHPVRFYKRKGEEHGVITGTDETRLR